jgi:hypothetical protein
MRIRPANQLPHRAVSWLWPGWLALGKLALLDGDPGLGKSLLTLDLCARLSTGRPFPDGSPAPAPANCVVLNGEDGAADTIGPRLEALGADLGRVFVLDHDDDLSAPLQLPAQTAALEEVVAQTQARLVVLDPLMAFLGPDVNTANDQSVRRALYPLKQLAGKHACAIDMVRHLNKTGDGYALYRGGGSIAFSGACRLTALVAADPEAPGRRILAQVKNNLGPLQTSLAFVVQSADAAGPVLSWLGTCPRTANELLGHRGAGTASPLQRAQAFLEAFLADGPRTTREIWAAARPHQLAPRTLHRARKELGIRFKQQFVDGERLSHWLLPGQQLSDATVPDMAEWPAPLRELFPPATPLDDED